ncbi:MAG: 4Fe-4S binding protein [Candidatus Lokiarchaeota archaeon]|nr:4Fe-4S binding protein [Candidatus Lokiarchaeota archaeon]
MNDTSKDLFRRLQEHLDSMPVGFPTTESGVEIRILKHLFTVEDAEIALKLKFQPEPLKKIYRRFKKSGIEIEELEQKLDEMYFKGSINRGSRNIGALEEKYYAIAALIIGMYEYQLGRLTKEFYSDHEQYIDEAFIDEYNSSGIPQLRVIPVEETLDYEQGIASYDDMKDLIEIVGEPIAVAECICRQAKELMEDPCAKTKLVESCFSFRSAAKQYLEKGFAREISKEEALEILRKAEEDGLVLQPGNSLRPMNICTCCGCCCGILTHQKKIPEPAKFFATNFYAEVDEDSCIGCETCVERCNMDAIEVEDAIAKVDLTRCIGCGVCVPTCTSEAIKLYKKEEETLPPRNTLATYMTIIDKKAEIARSEKE